MSNSGRTFRDMVSAVWHGHDPGGIVWQPRLEFWYAVNKARGTLPAHLGQASLESVYDYCHASIRYFGNGLRVRQRHVEIGEERLDAQSVRTTWKTPVGTLTEVRRYDEWGLSSHLTEYKIKAPADLDVLEYMLQHEEWFWDQQAYEADLARVGDRCVPQFYFRRSPVQGLMIEHMGLENTVYLMIDRPERLRQYVEVQTAADEAMYRVIGDCPVPVVNLGENIDAHMDPPSIWNEHLVPYYRLRTEQLHAAGKRAFILIDGAMKPLLPYLRACPWDGIEAATPLPQGDVTIDEIEQALGDLILLDGIPAIYFLPSFPESELIACVNELVERFHPRLILGISDEIPPDGDIERVRLVGEMVQQMG
ncbi:MAG TPA: hypothetical protein GX702_06680 [Chloroflexi bacterium]|jgi:hypothetical protein|nr:hypothetical protein [Chloroflexota bacterium]